jgi:hypothetical protein
MPCFQLLEACSRQYVRREVEETITRRLRSPSWRAFSDHHAFPADTLLGRKCPAMTGMIDGESPASKDNEAINPP